MPGAAPLKGISISKTRRHRRQARSHRIIGDRPRTCKEMKMSTGSPKDKPNRRLTQVSATTRTTDPAVEVGNQDERQWWARMRRAVANFFPEKAKRIPECSDAVAKPLTVTEQIY